MNPNRITLDATFNPGSTAQVETICTGIIKAIHDSNTGLQGLFVGLTYRQVFSNGMVTLKLHIPHSQRIGKPNIRCTVYWQNKMGTTSHKLYTLYVSKVRS